MYLEKYSDKVEQFVSVCTKVSSLMYVTGHGGNMAWKLEDDLILITPTQMNKGDITAAVKQDCKSWTRELVYLGYKYLLVLDRVETQDIPVVQRWQMHFPGETKVDEPEWVDDEARLAAQAECKDMAYKLSNLLEGMREHQILGAIKDVAALAERLYSALPDGSGE